MSRPFQPTLIATADPDFQELAWAELAPAGHLLSFLAPGVMVISLRESFWELAAQWHKQPPIFVRHICPVMLTLPAGHPPTLAHQIMAELSDLVEPGLPFSVQSRVFGDASLKPFDLNNALAGRVQQAPLDVRAPQQIFSLVVGPYQGQQTAFVGLSPTAYNLSDWAGGVRRFAHRPEQISRAEFKLLEALEQFRLPLPPGGHALDLGAAPGGWTRILRQMGQWVTAVDPAGLHPSLAADSHIRPLRQTAEAYLASKPDQFDLILNDMRLDARDSGRIMVQYAPHLYPHGAALMTLKLPEQKREQVIDHTFNILRPAYTIAAARHLFHNRSEITLYLKRYE